MIKLIVIKLLLLIVLLVSLNTGWGLCKLSNEENDKRDNQDKGAFGGTDNRIVRISAECL